MTGALQLVTQVLGSNLGLLTLISMVLGASLMSHGDWDILCPALENNSTSTLRHCYGTTTPSMQLN